LSEPVENFVLVKVLAMLRIYQLDKIAAISVVHHYAKMASLRLVNFTKCHDVGMVELLQNLGFPQCFPLFTLRHPLYIHLLNHAKVFRA
jgi:hypothetical protein